MFTSVDGVFEYSIINTWITSVAQVQYIIAHLLSSVSMANDLEIVLLDNQDLVAPLPFQIELSSLLMLLHSYGRDLFLKF